MNSTEYLAAIKGGNKTACTQIDGSLTALDKIVAPSCDAYPYMVHAVGANASGVKQIMANQRLHAEFLSNGGSRQGWTFGFGKLKVSGHGLASAILFAGVAIVLILHVANLRGMKGRVHEAVVAAMRTEVVCNATGTK